MEEYLLGLLVFIVIYHLWRYYHEGDSNKYSPVVTDTSSFSKFDIDEFSRVRQVVNEINSSGFASVFYGITDSDDVAVHIKKHFLFVQQIPELENYLKLMLDNFFRIARTLDLEIEKRRMAEPVKE